MGQSCEMSHQDHWDSNVWASIFGNRMIWSYLFPQWLNDIVYYVFLREVVPHVTMAVCCDIWFQRDEAQAQQHLSTHFPG